MVRQTNRVRMTTRERMAAVEDSLEARLKRVAQRFFPALRVGVAAGIAYAIAFEWVGHGQPFFAPISVVIIVGLSGGDRIKRALDMSLGCILGVLVGDLVFAPLGPGGWQIAAAVCGSMLFASFFSKSMLVANQVAIGSILISTIMPPDAAVTGFDRAVDAFIGSAVGLAVVALVPSAPFTAARQEISKVLSILSSVLDDVSAGISHQDPSELALALEAIRGTQSDIDAISSATKSGRESTQLSPFLWGSRRYFQSLSRAVPPTDNAVRSTRVLARRALVLVEDKATVSPRQLWILDQLSAIVLDLSELFESTSKSSLAERMPSVTNRLRSLAAETGLEALELDCEPPRGPYPPVKGLHSGAKAIGEPGQATLSGAVILAQSRSLIVDLLQICGWSRESAVAMLKPTSETPAYPPELSAGGLGESGAPGTDEPGARCE